MTLLVLCALWVIAASIVAFLPMRYQYAPGLVLLALAPVLIILIARDVSLWAALLAVLAFVSMFRNPLRYFARRAMGQHPEVPK